MEVKLKIWMEKDGKLLFGRGRENLLLAIDEAGSLSKAAKILGMSYRAAWGRLRASEERLGVRLVKKGGQKVRGMQLTEEGKEFLKKYGILREETERFVTRRSEQLFRGKK
jgi:molybdate transport system regulatory protein